MLKAPSVQALLTAARLKIRKAVSVVQSKMRSVSKGKGLYQTLGASGRALDPFGVTCPWGSGWWISSGLRKGHLTAWLPEEKSPLPDSPAVVTDLLRCLHWPYIHICLHLQTLQLSFSTFFTLVNFQRHSHLVDSPAELSLAPFITITLESQG